MEKQSNRLTLLEWMREIVPYNNLDKYLRERTTSDESIKANDGRFSFIVCTGGHTYRISGREHDSGGSSYLGCIATSRTALAGENWLRGNDLPDGPFNRETWVAIKDAILRYELAKLEPLHVPMAPRGLKTANSEQNEPFPDLSIFRGDTFYGPYTCEDCGEMIVRQDRLRGGIKFESLGLPGNFYPSNRPDFPWELHKCVPCKPFAPKAASPEQYAHQVSQA